MILTLFTLAQATTPASCNAVQCATSCDYDAHYDTLTCVPPRDNGSGIDVLVTESGLDVEVLTTYRDFMGKYRQECCVVDTGRERIDVLHLRGGDDRDTIRVDIGAPLRGQRAVIVETLGGSDQIIGSPVDDPDYSEFLYAGDGRDCISAQGGDDYLYGGAGDDALHAFEGNDVVYGGPGDDEVWGDQGDDVIYGEDGNDTLRGEDDDDELFGGVGDDFLDGEDGDDHLYGEAGADVLAGGDDDDYLLGGDGRDLMSGQAGNDVLWGGLGNDVLNGGVDDDVLCETEIDPTETHPQSMMGGANGFDIAYMEPSYQYPVHLGSHDVESPSDDWDISNVLHWSGSVYGTAVPAECEAAFDL